MQTEAPPQAAPALYNTMTRKKEPLETIEPGRVRMYNCGPTVYDYFHVGNARNFVAADMIRRYLEYRGYEVVFVQNITDIEDKIIRRAAEEGVTPAQIAEKFTKIFFESAGRLGVREADHHPRATDYVPKMIELVQRLEEKGYAYAVDGDVYFRVAKFEGYGKLSGRKLEDMQSGARVEVSERKEHPGDFTLWKAAKPGEPSWDSPWGPGRPGWHLECSVMAMDLLGDSFDVHMGGHDLTFPHHENEIAQSEAATGKPFARYWLHNGFLNVDGEKMSKSEGNFFTIDQVLAKFEPGVVRYFLLSAHYRAQLDFNEQALRDARVSLKRLREARQTARRLLADAEPQVEDFEIPEAVERIQTTFTAAMDDDFNTPRALAALFDAATQINTVGNRALEAQKRGEALADADRARLALLDELLDELATVVLGLDLEPEAETDAEGDDAVPRLLDLLIEIRAAARKEKQFALADRVRDGLKEIGYELTDRPDGTEWRRAG